MKNVLGGSEHACSHCGGTVVYLKVKRLGVVSQCRDCGLVTNGRLKENIKIYTYLGDTK